MNKQEYAALQAELEALEVKHAINGKRLYLADECIDRENADCDENHPDFWSRMYWSAVDHAGYAAHDYGMDINAMIGRIIY